MYLPLAFSMPGGMELVIILVIVLIIFGGGKLAGVGKSLGQGISEFKNAVKGEDKTATPTDDLSAKHTSDDATPHANS